MAVSVIELREEARLLDAELARQAAVSDSTDTRAGIAIGFAGVLAGLLAAVGHPDGTTHAAEIAALGSAFAGLLAAFPRRVQSPDPAIVADLYQHLPEDQAIAMLSPARLHAITANTAVNDAKRLLLAAAVVILVAAVILAVVAVT